MTTIYLIVLCLALAATLLFVVAFVHDRVAERGAGAGGDPGGRWYDGTLDRTLLMFPLAAAGLLAGLLLSNSDVDLRDLGVEAMLLAFGATAGERLLARQRHDGSGGRAAVAAACLVAGVIGGLAGLGS